MRGGVKDGHLKHYGIPGVTGDDFVRVELDASRRAGILTQAAASEGTLSKGTR